MTNLVELDLSYNLLQAVPQAALSDCHYLMILSLTGNPIRNVSRAQLAPLKYLQTLDVSSCQIVHIESQAFVDLKNLLWLKLDNNLIKTLDPVADFPRNTRGVTFNGNRWECDCKLIGLRDFLRNRTVSFQIDPLCTTPDIISGQQIRELSDNELACLPEVSPSSHFEEIISGKNMSLFCTVESIPLSRITWRYKGFLVKNGSTMVSDIDLRTYYYINTATGPRTITSQLILQRTTLDDNGVFQCEAENRAGVAVGNFTVSVVNPVPPESPKERKVEERFKQEYFVVIGVAAVIISILTIAISMIFIVKCRGIRRNCNNSTGPHLYQCSVSDSSFASDKSLMTVQTPKMSCLLDNGSSSEYSTSYIKEDLSYEECVLENEGITQIDKPFYGKSSILKKNYSIVTVGDSSLGNLDKSFTNPFNHIILTEKSIKDTEVSRRKGEQESICPLSYTTINQQNLPDVTSLEGENSGLNVHRVSQLIPCESNEGVEAKSSESRPPDNHWHFSTLPRKKLVQAEGTLADKLSINLQHFVPIPKGEELILPPPPQFKEFHSFLLN